MEMTRSSSTMLKPFYSTPHPLAGEMVPLTLFDLSIYDIFVPIMLVYPAPTPSNEELKEGLRRAVALYPHLAGRFAVDHQGRRCIHINNEGVLVVEATVAVDLSTSSYPDRPLPEEHDAGVALLQIKLNRYKCGGLAIGLATHHFVADGHSMSTFLTTWASAVQQGRDFTPPSPFLDRGITAVTRCVPTPAVFDRQDPYAPLSLSPSRFNNITVHFTAEFIAELKARVGVRSSTFQCLLAHLWKRITAARRLKPEEFTQVRVAVNCRGKADPPIPLEFFGNMVLGAFPRLQVQDVLSWSYDRVVGAIRDAVARIDGDYVRSFLNFGAAHGEELTGKGGTMCCPNLEADSWLGFRFHDLDFGGGPPAMFQVPDLPVEGLMVFMPSSVARGGVDVYMSVAEDHVTAFQQICHSLD
ncbi:tryptamine benzoyltransferase 1-like [Lolium rigidum]|uniref:tryptamine benzoyltransferase 1-like n=1 Tax=Lolium rigidum TaxID=89674 RepID=UPI001F5DF390|nr:tryptamine benzoyltransferase 1-like [Lolium rigidum]